MFKNEDEDEDEDDEVDSEMLRKLDKDEFSSILLDYHPEIKQNNYNDIIANKKQKAYTLEHI